MKKSNKIAHSELVTVAREWLRKTQKCSVVVSELKCMSIEQPDAIGWYNLNTHLVECKTSRADFLRDKKKIFRHYLDGGMGDFRWYLTLPNIIKSVDELPKNFGWLEYDGKKVKILHKATYQPHKNDSYEASVLISVIKRIGQTEPEGCSIRCYTYQTKNTAAIDITY